MELFRSRRRVTAGQQQKTAASLPQAIALYQAGRFAEAEAEARAVASRRSWPPRQDAPLARGLAAAATSAQGRHLEALATFDELLLVFRSVFGAGHPQTLLLRSNRAQTLTALSRHAECERECAAVARATARERICRTSRRLHEME
jgi:tetratricopeptide (TPR) repeat protein